MSELGEIMGVVVDYAHHRNPQVAAKAAEVLALLRGLARDDPDFARLIEEALEKRRLEREAADKPASRA